MLGMSSSVQSQGFPSSNSSKAAPSPEQGAQGHLRMDIPNIGQVHTKARRHQGISGGEEAFSRILQVLGGSCSLRPRELDPGIQCYVMQHLQQIPGFFPLPTLMGPGEFFPQGLLSPEECSQCLRRHSRGTHWDGIKLWQLDAAPVG